MRAAATVVALLYVVPALADPANVRLQDPRFEITLFAEQPQIWTPTGIAVNSEGQVLAIESNTHLPKSDYPGPKTDRIKIFTDKDRDGHADEVAVFAEGFRWAMNMAFVGADLYIVQRDAVIVLHDGKPDACEQILTLETKGDFPHNGLGGFCASIDGSLFIGLGENLGLPYTLKGKDGSSVSGGGEGGNIFKCQRDGTKLELFATGFWNPFAMTFDVAGNLFAVDNDPDGRPPCRLLHVIRGGNYGYQFRYGRSGLHPFVAWDGELPGTLPMVSGTGEAPSGLLGLPRIGWPAEYSDSLLGTSWGDNLLETFPLEPRGASFKADRKLFARGDQSFRPVALAASSDGSVYVTDWADVQYPVHQKGRIWKLAYHGPRNKPDLENSNSQILNEIAQIPQRSKNASDAANELLKHADNADPFVRSAAVTQLASLHREVLIAKRTSKNPRERLAILLALREKPEESNLLLLKRALQDPDEDIRRIAIIWTAEQRQTQLQKELLAAALKEPTSLALVQTYLGAREILSGYEKKSVWDQGSSGAELVEKLLKDESQPAELRDLARKLKSAPQLHPIVGAPVAESAKRPKTEGEWLAAIGFGGEPEPGRKLFFSEKVACFKCHKVLGEGGSVGPDLSVIARSSDRAKLVNSILQPSANIGPLYVTHEIKTKDGEAYTGLVPESKTADKLTVILADGRRVEILNSNIESDRTSEVSLMPAGLENGLSVREFADLISFLQTLR
jgi:hypothetical protein